jgi:hypothetical protein
MDAPVPVEAVTHAGRVIGEPGIALAGDSNPGENLDTGGGHADPPRCKANAGRSRQAPGPIHQRGAVTRAFGPIGWGWDGRWVTPKGYQHFPSNGH